VPHKGPSIGTVGSQVKSKIKIFFITNIFTFYFYIHLNALCTHIYVYIYHMKITQK